MTPSNSILISLVGLAALIFSYEMPAVKASPVRTCSDGYCQRISDGQCLICDANFTWFYCGADYYAGCGGTKGQGRNLEAHEAVTTLRGDDDKDIPGLRNRTVDRCGDYDYDGYLHVDEHLYAVAMPKEEAVAAGCPFLAAHAMLQDNKEPGKEVILWNNVEEGRLRFPLEEAHAMGTFSLSELASAFEKAEPTNDDEENKFVYDVIKNNCGSFMINLGNHLGVRIDAGVASFVARRLLEHSGKSLVNSIRSSVNFPSLFQQKDSGRRLGSTGQYATDKQVVERLVDTYASQLYQQK